MNPLNFPDLSFFQCTMPEAKDAGRRVKARRRVSDERRQIGASTEEKEGKGQEKPLNTYILHFQLTGNMLLVCVCCCCPCAAHATCDMLIVCQQAGRRARDKIVAWTQLRSSL